jgi:hypothetical protein
MSRFHLVFVAALALGQTACERTIVVRDRCDEPRAGEGLTPGERVLARYKDAFHEGTVVTVQGRLVTVAWDDASPERSYLPRSWVRSMEHRSRVTRGEWALCRAAASWELCRVDGLQPGSGLVEASLTSSGQRSTLKPNQVFQVPDKLRGWAEENGSELLTRARRQELLAHARPAAAGQAVQVGQRVLAEWQTDSWWEARVVRADKGQVTVRWADGSSEQSVQASQVAPLEPVGELALRAEQDIALCQWGGGSGQWWSAVIERVSHGSVEVTYSDGTKGQLTPGQCLPARAAPR